MTQNVMNEAKINAPKGLKYIDCDVHPVITDMKQLHPYMTQSWIRRFEMSGIRVGAAAMPERYAHPAGGPLRRDEAIPPGGGVPGSDPKHMIEHYFNQHNLEAAILLPLQPAGLASWVNIDSVNTLVRAYNEYFINEWLSLDKRFKYGLVAAPQDPVASAEEIRRLGKHEGVACVYLPMINTLMGNRYFKPIHEAAAEMNLPIVTHVTAGECTFEGVPNLSGGTPSSYIERYGAGGQFAMTNLSSFIFEGIFEKYPTLKVGFVEYGFSWVLSQMWRMDKIWKALRLETPWVKKYPSEYLREHVRFTTQPIDEPENPQEIVDVIKMMHGDEILMFSSDYPHWDNDMPRALSMLDQNTKQKIFYDNAKDFYRL